MGYHIGNYKHDAPKHRGWFVGTFIEGGAAKTDVAEIKYAEFPIGFNEHPMKVSGIFECSIIIEGRSKAIIDGQNVELKAGDFIAIDPGTPNNLMAEIIEPVKVFCIKAPSDPSAKKILEKTA